MRGFVVLAVNVVYIRIVLFEIPHWQAMGAPFVWQILNINWVTPLTVNRGNNMIEINCDPALTESMGPD